MVPARHRNKCGKRQRLPTCLHPIDGYAKSAMYCLFSLEIYKYDPTRKQTGVTASQTSWYQQRGGSLLLIAPSKRLRESRSRDGALRLHLMLRREGEREGGRGRKENLKRTFFFSSSLVTKAVHIWVGPDRAELGEVSGQGGVLVYSRLQLSQAAGGETQSMGLSADCEGISSTAPYNSFSGVSILSHVSLNICSTFILQVQWSVNTTAVAV